MSVLVRVCALVLVGEESVSVLVHVCALVLVGEGSFFMINDAFFFTSQKRPA